MSKEEKSNEESAHEEGPRHIGYPISDDSSEDEASQIRALEEDHGIFYHEEVVAPPKYESDDEDIPVGGRKILERQPEVEQNRAEDSMDNSEDEGRDTASRMGRRRSVRFSGTYDQDGHNIALRSPSPESLRYMKALENPMLVKDDDEKSQEEEEEEEFEELVKGPKEGKHPFGSPPAYTSGDEQKLTALQSQKDSDEPKPQPKKTRGSLNELLLTKVAQPFQNMMRRASRLEEDSSSDDDDEDDDYTEEEIQVLTYIDAFKPVEIDLKPQLRPFPMDFMPCIGEIDGFVKVPRPDEVDDNNGITSLDEPASQQSDATILNMQLRNVSKEISSSKQDDIPVKQLARADKNSDEIEKWIVSIKELHKTKPAQTVHYKGVMPDIDSLMEEWAPILEEKLRTNKLPSADLDVPLDEYADILLNLFDIPVGKSRIHSLHLLFSLLSEFNNSQHFRNLAQNNQLGGQTGEHMDCLEL